MSPSTFAAFPYRCQVALNNRPFSPLAGQKPCCIYDKDKFVESHMKNGPRKFWLTIAGKYAVVADLPIRVQEEDCQETHE